MICGLLKHRGVPRKLKSIKMERQADLFQDAQFNGSDYVPALDQKRLTGQIQRVHECMIDGKFRTLGEIEAITGDPQASISAQLRHLRKERFGSYTLNKQRRGNRENGLFEYQLIK